MDDMNDIYTRFPVPIATGIKFINLRQVIYCESSRSYTVFKMTDQTEFISSYALHYWQENLPAGHFCRISRSHIINKDHVTDYVKGKDGTVYLDHKFPLTVSRLYRTGFFDSMGVHSISQKEAEAVREKNF